MIEAKNITKQFGDKLVLDNVSARFEKGKTNLIIGASGSGKTTLSKCIVGLHPMDSGKALYDDKDFGALSASERREIRKEIGFLFQGSALFDSMNVEENVSFPLEMFTNMTSEERKDRVNFCLSRVNLTNTNHLFPSELSGGMKKRVGIARAIAVNPKYLFCDEPNSGLDPQTATIIDQLIKDITEEYQITTVVITHDMNSVMEIGDNIVFLFNGRKWWEGNRKDILQSDNNELCDFVYANEFLKSLKK